MLASWKVSIPLLEPIDETPFHLHCCSHCFHLRSMRVCLVSLIDYVYSIPKQHRSAREHWRSSLTYMFVFTMSTTCRTAIAWFFSMRCSTSITLKINANATHKSYAWDRLPLKNWHVYVSLRALNEEKEKTFRQSKKLEEQLNHDHATILLERSLTKVETRYYWQRYSSSYPI